MSSTADLNADDDVYVPEWDESIQPSPDDPIGEIIEGVLSDKRRKRARRSDLSAEATVRGLLHRVQTVIAAAPSKASPILEEIHYTIRYDDDLETALERLETSDEIESAAEARQVRQRFKRHCRTRDRGNRHPDPEAEFKTLYTVAMALGYTFDPTDPRRYAPVRMQSLDHVDGAESVAEPTPVARRLLPADTQKEPEQAAVDIPHESAGHHLIVAKPRKGKDSTSVSMGKNLYEEHGYKYVSIYDDGRCETPMTAIPTDEQTIIENLSWFEQEPDAFDANVYVPRMESLPDELPSNFVPFTIGIESLTPELILRLSQVNTSDPTAEDRIKQELKRTKAESGQVDQLVKRLMLAADEQEEEIEWSEPVEQQGEHAMESHEVTVSVPRSKAMEESARRLAMLANQGIIAGVDARTNIDIEEIMMRTNKAAILFCSLMPEGTEPLKYRIIDLWLRLIFETATKGLAPRTNIEIRELDNLAPSKIGHANYKDQIKSVLNTLVDIVEQGGSRRVNLMASTQKLNDVEKSVRTKFNTNIFLQIGDEEIKTLSDSFDFSPKEKRQLKSFPPGMGMLAIPEGRYYPVQFRGAPCGLGLGDLHWLDRYGMAWGCRVNYPTGSGDIQGEIRQWMRDHSDDEWWVEEPTLEVRAIDDPPQIRHHYSTWHLVASDYERHTYLDEYDRPYTDDGALDPDVVSRPLTDQVLRNRRHHHPESDLSLELDCSAEVGRQVTLYGGAENDEEMDTTLFSQYDVPGALERWVRTASGKKRDWTTVERFVSVCRMVKHEDELSTLSDIAQTVQFSESSLRNYTGPDKPLEPCLKKNSQYYELTTLGEKALQIDWQSLLDEMPA